MNFHEEEQLERLPKHFTPFKPDDLSFPLSNLKQEGKLNTRSTSFGNFSQLKIANYKNQKVILKTLKQDEDPSNHHYIFIELAILKNLNDKYNIPYIMGYLGAAASSRNKNYEIIMINEYLERGDVKQALQQDSQFFKKDIHPSDLDFVWKQRIRVINHISEALKQLHDLHIVHRDIKCENIFLKGRGRKTIFKLGDFGMARGIHSIDEDLQRTYTICGTDELMAPEMHLCLPYDHSVDIYSFGMVIAELICGKGPSSPFSQNSTTSVHDRFLERKAAESFDLDLSEIDKYALAGCPLDLIELCKQCLNYEIRYRISSSDLNEMIKELCLDLNKRKAQRVPAKVKPRQWALDKRRGSFRPVESKNLSSSKEIKTMFDLVDKPETYKKELQLENKIQDESSLKLSKHSQTNKVANVARRQLRQLNRKLMQDEKTSNLIREKLTTNNDGNKSQGKMRNRANTAVSQSTIKTQRTIGRRVKALQQHLATKARSGSIDSRGSKKYNANML